MMNEHLVKKYNVPGPRYTSYPTVPYWDNKSVDPDVWKREIAETFRATNSEKGISLYIHLPFCESLCSYCGCNVRRTINHDVEDQYIDNLKKEWLMYLDLFNDKPQITEIHLGGGTPTFFSPENLQKILAFILNTTTIHPAHSFSFEGDPRNTSHEHLQALYNLGFRRVSFGIQDFDPEVQETINRIQPFEQVEKVTKNAREIGYTSINFDLIYGLPKQTVKSVTDTVKKTNLLRPDRIAFYSYAHIPKKLGMQRTFDESDLPVGDEKRKLYESGKLLLEENGYIEIGMDHFALPHDSLTKAFENNTLHRNFMGYGTTQTDLMIGLGVSSIGDSGGAFGQNTKTLRQYEKALENNQLPIFRGHLLSREDAVIRRHILNLICTFETPLNVPELQLQAVTDGVLRMAELKKDGLVEISAEKIAVTPLGKPFIRNICMALDAKLHTEHDPKKLFSTTV